MEKRLFLTGPAGCGKSQLIRRTLGPRMAQAGGFVTRQALSPDGALLGLDLLPAAAAAGVSGYEPQRFLFFEGIRPKTDNEVYRNLGVQLLQEALYYPFAVLDEFGSFELIIPQFRQALEELLNADLPCLGCLKTPEEAELFRQYLGIGERYTLYNQRLWNALKSDADTSLISMEAPDDPSALKAVEDWAAQYTL